MNKYKQSILDSGNPEIIKAEIDSIWLAMMICKINIARGIEVDFCKEVLDEHLEDTKALKQKLDELSNQVTE
jgi:hypothetical protein